MTAGELKEWLHYVPDDAQIVAILDNDQDEAPYTVEPLYSADTNTVELKVGV